MTTPPPTECLPDIGKAPLAARLSGGLGFALGGVGLALKHAELRWPALLAVALNFVIYGALVALGFHFIADFSSDPNAAQDWFSTAMRWGAVALRALLLALWLLGSLWGAIALGGILAGPLFDLLSERTEKMLIGRTVGPPFSFTTTLQTTVREVLIQLKLLFLYAPVSLGILLVGLLPVVGALLGPTLAWVWTALWVSMNFAGPTIARHGLGARQRLELLLKQPALATSFGAVGGIPFLSFFLLPLLGPGLVVGMTRMYLALAAYDHVPSQLSEAEKLALRAELPSLPKV